MKLSWRTAHLHLTDPFSISRETKTVKHNVIVEVADDAHTGFGEAAPSPFYGQSMETVLKALEEARRLIPRSGEDPGQLALKAGEICPGDSAARAAVDMALQDLAAKRAGLPLHAHLGLAAEIAVPTSFTIGIDSPQVMVEKVGRVAEYPILKVKLGFRGDMDALRAVREATDQTIRVDVNGGWSLEEAMARFPLLISLGVEFVEQPLPRGELEGLKTLRDRFPLLIFADEDALLPEDIPRLAGAVDGINVKLMKCGGVRPALQMIEEARKRELRVMIGCMIESSVGITAAAHLASLADYLDLDGNLLIEDDPFTGVRCESGRLILPSAPGLGAIER